MGFAVDHTCLISTLREFTVHSWDKINIQGKKKSQMPLKASATLVSGPYKAAY